MRWYFTAYMHLDSQSIDEVYQKALGSVEKVRLTPMNIMLMLNLGYNLKIVEINEKICV